MVRKPVGVKKLDEFQDEGSIPQQATFSHEFTSDQLVTILDTIVDRTLGEIDSSGVFARHAGKRKVTGIAGDVIEQSVLGYPANPSQEPDIVVDGVPTEVKVTGIRRVTRDDEGYQAKEPMTITAVSVDTIVGEEFETSRFWHKVEQMLLVYYLYDSDTTVPAPGYADFPVRGYEIHRFDEHDTSILREDWTIVRDFIRMLQRDYDNPEGEYPRISHELRSRLMFIDTAPKWPNNPRFRLKRALVSEIVRSYFERRLFSVSQLTIDGLDSFDGLDRRCRDVTETYHGFTVEELVDRFGLEVKDRDRMPKSIAETIVIRMFGGDARKLSDIDLFRVAEVNAKTICLTSRGGRTEDTKMMPVNFREFLDPDVGFEESEIYDYFMNHHFLCIVFMEADRRQRFRDNVFLGIKRFIFPYEFVDREVRRTWEDVRETVRSGNLREEVVTNRAGEPRINPSGTVRTEVNFPKSKDHDVFLRGSGTDSTRKTVELCGIRMYRQHVWVKGLKMIELLDATEFL